MRRIREPEIHRPGLALSGFVQVFTYWRLQIMGNTEIGYLDTLPVADRIRAISLVLGFDVPCIIVTNNNLVPAELIEIANQNAITIFLTPFSTTKLIHYLGDYLESTFAPSVTVHGSLVDVFSVGMLISGPSAIGKSELTLDLIERGHQLVADDAICITRVSSKSLIGSPSELLAHHMEIRGVGIIDVRRMFGIRGIRGKKIIDLLVDLQLWDESREYDRLGVDETITEILGVELPLVELPIMSGKNLTVITEAIAMNHKLKQNGEYPAKEFKELLQRRLGGKSQQGDQDK